MAESMKGLHRSHRCTEVSSANIGDGLGTEEKKFRKSDLYRLT